MQETKLATMTRAFLTKLKSKNVKQFNLKSLKSSKMSTMRENFEVLINI